MSVQERKENMNPERYAELRRILEDRRREMVSEVKDKMRDVRAEGGSEVVRTGLLGLAAQRFVESAVERGEIRATVRPEVLSDLLLGALTTALANWSASASYDLRSELRDAADALLLLFSTLAKIVFRLGLDAGFFRLYYEQESDEQRRRLAGSAIGGIRETQEMLDFCGEHSITADVEVIGVDKINEAFGTFKFEGTSLAKEFKDRNGFLPVVYRKDWEAVMGILEANGVAFTRDSPEYRRLEKRGSE